MNLEPLSDRVVIEPSEQSDVSPGGIHLPETAKERPMQGKILAVGPGRYENGIHIKMSVAVGDTVLYAKYAGTEIKLNGNGMLVLREVDLLAIVTG